MQQIGLHVNDTRPPPRHHALASPPLVGLDASLTFHLDHLNSSVVQPFFFSLAGQKNEWSRVVNVQRSPTEGGRSCDDVRPVQKGARRYAFIRPLALQDA